MPLDFIYRNPVNAARVLVFPGAYNPPTVAHVEIARAALAWADEIVWVLPRAFPHKSFEGAGFADRCALLQLVAARNTGFSVAISQGGLYGEIAAEARESLDPDVEIGLLCGRDAAVRIAAWDYGDPDYFARMLQAHVLVVASRSGTYTPVASLSHRVVNLPLPASFDAVSSSEVRERIAAGTAWRHLVPDEIADRVQALYAA